MQIKLNLIKLKPGLVSFYNIRRENKLGLNSKIQCYTQSSQQ